MLPLAVFIGYEQYHSAGWAMIKNFIIIRFRTLNRTTVITLSRNIQTQTISQSWFQKEGHLAAYHISVMSKQAGVGAHFKVNHLEENGVYALMEK